MRVAALEIRNFRSIAEARLEFHQRITLLTGRNNSGKSNVLDALSFLHATRLGGLDHGLNVRGGFDRVVYAKDPSLSIQIAIEFALDPREQESLHEQVGTVFSSIGKKHAVAKGLGSGLRYSLSFGRSDFEERLYIGWTDGYLEIAKGLFKGGVLEYSGADPVALRQWLEGRDPPNFGFIAGNRISGGMRPIFEHLQPPNPLIGEASSVVRAGLAALILRMGPNRNPATTTQITGASSLTEDGQNLADWLDYLRSNHPKRFAEFERTFRTLVPESTDLNTPRLGGPSTTLTIAESWFPDVPGFDLGASSFGERNLLVLVARILDRQPGLLAIEEPENSIHPKAQRSLARFLWEASQDRQIVVTTHSPVFVSQFPMDSLRLLLRERGATGIYAVDSTNVTSLINELGVRPSDVLDQNAIVLVEGETDEVVLDEWLTTLRRSGDDRELAALRCIFLGVRGLTNIPFYLDSRILGARSAPPTIFTLTDGDVKSTPAKAAQWKMVRASMKLPDDRVFSLAEGTIIEDYLLQPGLLARTFPDSLESGLEVSKAISVATDPSRTAKDVLTAVLDTKGLRYNVDTAARIARSFSVEEIDNHIKRIIAAITKSVAE